MAYLTLSYRDFGDGLLRLNDALGAPGLRETLGTVVWLYHNAQKAERDRGTALEIAKWCLLDVEMWPTSEAVVKALADCEYIKALDDGQYVIRDMDRQLKKLAASRKANQWSKRKREEAKAEAQEPVVAPLEPMGEAVEEPLKPWAKDARVEKFKHRGCDIQLEHDGNPTPGHYTGVWTGFIWNPKRTGGHAFNTDCASFEDACLYAKREAAKLNPPTPLRAPLPPAAPSAASGPTFSEGRRVSCSPAPESTPMEGERSVEGEGNGEKNGDAPTTAPVRTTNTRRRKTPVNQEVLSTIAPEDLATRKPPRRAKPSAEERVAELRRRIPGSFVWTSYSNAYEKRYGVKPERNAKVSTQATLLVKRIGLELAEQVASFYVEHNDAYYVNRAHPIELLVTQYQKLVTEMRRGVTMTMTKAKRDEVHAETDAAIRNYIAKQEGTDVAKDVSESPVNAG